ncbi:MAG TPA: metal-dependent transcriptional regulator [Actinomycetota bacterium]|nr:metal-dependent transcriptional regulator [Actinomycetota bacterium]
MATETHGAEGYLEAVYELNEEGVTVVQARIAERLGVSRAAVSEQVRRLTAAGMVEPGAGREIVLTRHGRRVAEDAVRRHRMAERFLVDFLKMPWHLVHQEAEKLQEALTGALQEHVAALLDGPGTCPHGNPIPGTGAVFRTDLVQLREFSAGDEVVLERLLEDVELRTDTLKYFEEHGLMPGNKIRVVAVAPDGTMTLEVGGVSCAIGADLTDNLWVAPV